MPKALLFAMMGTFLWSGAAAAQVVRYVDNIETCKGGAPCYKTVTAAVAAALPGDTVAVFPGIYDETVTLAQDKLTLRAHANAQPPVITAVNIHYGNTQAAGVRVLNLIVAGDISMVATDAPVIEGNLVQGRIWFFHAYNGIIRNNTVLGHGIGGSNSDNWLIEGNTLVGTDAWITPGGDETYDITVRRNVVRGGSIWMNGRVSATVEGNFVSGSAQYGIFVWQRGGGLITVQRNTVVGSGEADLFEHQDAFDPAPPEALWRNNRAGTVGGAATR